MIGEDGNCRPHPLGFCGENASLLSVAGWQTPGVLMAIAQSCRQSTVQSISQKVHHVGTRDNLLVGPSMDTAVQRDYFILFLETEDFIARGCVTSPQPKSILNRPANCSQQQDLGCGRHVPMHFANCPSSCGSPHSNGRSWQILGFCRDLSCSRHSSVVLNLNTTTFVKGCYAWPKPSR